MAARGCGFPCAWTRLPSPSSGRRQGQDTLSWTSTGDREARLAPIRPAPSLLYSADFANDTADSAGSLARGEASVGTSVSVASLLPLPQQRPAIPARDKMGAVYTKPWVADLILDLVGYVETRDLAPVHAVEPSAGTGAFLIPMARRLLASARRHHRRLDDLHASLRAYELDKDSAEVASDLLVAEMRAWGATIGQARRLADGWLVVDDYLTASPGAAPADVVAGNPPYVRYDDVPPPLLTAYRRLYPTMVGRGDVYIGFIEAALRQLKPQGVLGFICADRWMRSAYGVELRRLIGEMYSVDTVIEMHRAPAFEEAVAAYPAVMIVRRARQRDVIIASAGPDTRALPDHASLANAVVQLADRRVSAVPGLSATRLTHWFVGGDPWPALPPRQFHLLQRLAEAGRPLEDAATGTRIGIGVATGADKVFLTTDPDIVEPDRLLPLALASDTKSGRVRWSRHYLIDPWLSTGELVDLRYYPKLRSYFARHRAQLERRNIAQRSRGDWYRTIDRVQHDLTSRPKLYFPDMKLASNPTLDGGGTYPHHNLYFLVSSAWDLEVLGGLLLSRLTQLFIEAYCVKMRGGTLRFQAQYLRRIRVPAPDSMPDDVCDRLRHAFRNRDIDLATRSAAQAYGLAECPRELLVGVERTELSAASVNRGLTR